LIHVSKKGGVRVLGLSEKAMESTSSLVIDGASKNEMILQLKLLYVAKSTNPVLP